MHPPLRRSISTLLIVLGPLGATIGCARSTTSVVAPPLPATASFELDPAAIQIGDSPTDQTRSPQPFYPLAIGNHWTYDRTFTSRFGFGPDQLAQAELHSVVTRDITCSMPIGFDTYLSEHTLEQDTDYVFNSWILYRQDPTGLFEADYLFTDPPACETGAPLNAARRAPDLFYRAWITRPESQSPLMNRAMVTEWGRQKMVLTSAIEPISSVLRSSPSLEAALPEIQRLGYPMRGGSRWITRNQPRFTSRVLTRQRLHTPAGNVDAYKILISSELFGPRDHVYVWYGKIGFIGIVSHAEGYVVDENGIFAGWLSSDYREILTGYQLQEPVAGN